ncbi:MAG TPA: 30S ribosomal protein S1 [Acidimicrobiia bacterium]|jgi:small subunit ribosomal protein S1|nr:30S ribosomal protein S1 [Acidimicrobiia bacterium]
MSNPQENAPVATTENEEVEAPETPAVEVDTEATAPTEESQIETAEVTAQTESEAAPAESGEDAPRYQEREALVAPDLSHLPDDIGDDFEKAIEATVLEFREGDIVEGTIVSVDSEGALVDIGYKSEGFIPTRELSIRNNIDPEETVSVGDRVESVVLDKEDDEGRLILSKKRAMYERAWGRIQQVAEQGGTVEGTVIEVVKGGLIVDIGLRGFLPASLVDLRRVRDLDPFIGDTITAKVIELDRARNNVVLSRRAHLEEALAEERTEFLDNLHEGEIREGTVSSVVNFGAFVDLGGMDGLVHVSELSWQHVNHPSELVKVGDEVKVKVLEVDRDRERISLSIRQTTEDPWDVFSKEHEVGDVVPGVVTKTVPFGAFVSVADGVEGLVHVSEIAVHRVESPELELSIGQTVQVKITEKEDERRRVSLSIKQALPDYKERPAPTEEKKKPRREREFEREFGAEAEERPPMPVDASLEAILKELKERGIGRR